MWQIHANNRVFRVVTDRDGAIGVARMIGSSHIVSPEGQRIKL